MSTSVRRLLVLALVAALGGGVTQAVAKPARKPSAKLGGGVTQAVAKPARKPSAKLGGGMTEAVAKPARKPSAKLGGGATEQAVAKPAKKASKHRAARKASVKKKPQRAHAVKLDASVVWGIPFEALTSAPPLIGTTGTPATPASMSAPTITTDPASGDTPTPPPGSGEPAQPPSSHAVGVTVDDRTGYSARLSRATVTAGPVVVQLHNQGEDDHNLRVVPTDHAGSTVDFPITGPSENTTKTLTLTAGSYRLFCTLTTPVNHETAGMNATLTVS